MNLLTGKACGPDLIINEFIKYSPTGITNAIIRFFNIIFNSGVVPSIWSTGIILPLYNGDKMIMTITAASLYINIEQHSGGSKGGGKGGQDPPEIPGKKFLHMENILYLLKNSVKKKLYD